MRSKPVATDLRRRSPVVQFSHFSPAQALKPLLVSAAFGLVLASAFSATAAQGANAVGTIAGSAAVSATGAATYTIPISLPPGTNGMQPSLALVYDSQSGEGLAGYGWTLSGLSAITRCPWTIDDGGKTMGVEFGTIAGGHSDKFCLDGQRLLQTNGAANYGSGNMTYSTTINNYAQIQSIGTSGNSSGVNGPAYFKVTTKDGRVYEYGHTTDSQIQAQWQGGTVRVWALDMVTDLNGNTIIYKYSGNGDGGNGFEYWPISISYTGNSNIANNTGDHLVTFTYQPRPAGSVTGQYQYGNLVTNSQLLSSIQVSYTGSSSSYDTSFTYSLAYQQDSANGRNQLTSVQESSTVNGVTTSLNPTTISWQSAQAGWIAGVQTGYTTDQAHAVAAHLMDVDGDGIQDLVYPAPISSGSSTYDWFVMFGQPGGGFTAPVDTGEELWPNDSGNDYTYALAADVNGDGRMDLLVPIPSTAGWNTLIATGSRAAGLGGIFRTAPNEPPNLSATNSVTNKPIFQGNVWAADFSGRGLTDVVYDDGANMYILQNEGTSWQNAFANQQKIFTNSSISRPANQNSMDVPLDFDGSGRGGAMITSTAQSGATTIFALTSSEPPATLSVMGGGNGTDSGSAPMPIDGNGDGLTDVLFVLGGGAQWMIGLSNGTGFNNLTTGITADTATDAVIADYDNSGRQTAIVHSTNGNWYTLAAEYVEGTGFTVSSGTTSTPFPSGYVQGTLRVGNIEANGMDDLVYGVLNPSNGNVMWEYALHKGSTWPPDTVTNITDGFGNYCNFVYESLANGAPFYTEGNSASYPTRDIQPALQVISYYTESTGSGSANKYTFTYAGAQTELAGRGFLGFASRTITDVFSGTTETIQYAQAFPYTGMVTSDKVNSNGSGTPIVRDTENTGLDAITVIEPYGTAYMPYFDSSITTNSNYTGSSSQTASTITTTLAHSTPQTGGNQSSSFDAYGNVISQQTSVLDGATGLTYSSSTSATYTADTGTYCVGLPTSVTVTRTQPSGPAISRTTTSNADTAHCQLAPSSNAATPSTTLTSGVAGSPSLSTSYTYDSFGNVNQTVISGNGIDSTLPNGGRTTSSVFGGNGEFSTSASYVVSSSLTLTTQANWEYSLGFKLSDTDANGKSTNYVPDPFGRLASVTRPDGTQTLYTYNWCSSPTPGFTCPASALYEVTTTQVSNDSTPAINTGYTAYDSRGRPVEQGTKLLGGVLSLVDTTYEQVGPGHVISVTRPYFSGTTPEFKTSYTWDDVFNRVTSITQPENANDPCSPSCNDKTSFSYSVVGGIGFGVTMLHTVSAGSETTIKYTDALGEVVQMTDANLGQTLYSYDALGDLTKTTDADNNQTTLGYDGLGHKTSMTDPDMGQWGYQVDALGEVLCQTDAKNQSIIMVYDGLGRVANKYATGAGGGCNPNNLPTGTVTSSWAYDQAGTLGLPASMSDSNGFLRAYGYDTLERPSNVTTTIPGNSASYTVATTYDGFSRVATVTYPVSATPTTDPTPTAVATASPNTYVVGTSGGITLNGSGSSDPTSGEQLQYQWSQTAGPNLGLGGLNTSQATSTVTPSLPGIYSFQLQVIDSESAISAPASVSVTVKLPPPPAPQVSPNPSTNGTVTLNWSSVPNASSYNVYSSTDNVNFTLNQNVSGTTASVTGLSNGTYYFAIGSAGNQVNGNPGASTSVLVTLPPGVPTSTKVNVSAILPNSTYTVSWTAPGYGTVTSYVVAEDTSSGFTNPTYITVSGSGSNPPATSLNRSKAAVGTYYYKVQACNQTACNNFSNTASVQVLNVPSAPSLSANPTSISSGSSSVLSWTPHSSPVTSYVLQSATVSNFNPNSQIYSGSATSDTVSPNVSRYYRVQACDAVGCGAWSASVFVTVSGGTGCKTCSQTAPPGGGTTSAPVSSTGGTPTADIIVPAAIKPLDLSTEQRLSLALAPMHMDSAVTQLKRERLALIAVQPKQLPESVLQARATKRFQEQQPALLPPAPGADVTAYNAAQMARMGHDPHAPAYEPPTYIAYGNAHVASATGSPYQFAVTYNYDPSSGALESVSDASTKFIYWRVASGSSAPVDAFGHLMGYIDGNNVSTVNSFDAATGVVTGIGTGTGQASAIQQLAYAWDGFGNLQQRCDANKGLIETFSYDGINRLKTSTVHTGGTTGQCSMGPNAGAAIGVTYTNSGNIQTLTNSMNSAVGGTYAYDPSHAHAVSTVTNIPGTNSYDNNGNMVCRFGTGANCTGGTQITWNADNLPTQITGPNGSSSFSYGPDLQRYLQTASDASGNATTTTYIGGLFEVVSTSSDTQYRHNIMASGGVVAIHAIHQSGVVETDYIHSDHLGSGDVITDDTGNIATDPVTHEPQIMSFDAFGLRRDPNNWSYDLTPTQIGGLKAKTDSGYTYQEQLDNVSLVHMNGRVYDPTTGRFISADPVVQNPAYSQAFNRYTYAYNNPLNATDPSGFDVYLEPSNETDFPPLQSLTPSSGFSSPGVIQDQITDITIFNMNEALNDNVQEWTTPSNPESATNTSNASSSNQSAGTDNNASGGDDGSNSTQSSSATIANALNGSQCGGCTMEAFVTEAGPGALDAIAQSASKSRPAVVPFSHANGSMARGRENAGRSATSNSKSGSPAGGPMPGNTLSQGGAVGMPRQFLDSNGCMLTGGGPAICFGPMAIEEVGAGLLTRARALGQAGEAAVRAVYDIGDPEYIRVNGVLRIPDGVKSGVLSEVKNVSSLSLTQQLRDYMQYSLDNRLQFDLYVRPGTQLSGPLENMISSGQINLKYIPGP